MLNVKVDGPPMQQSLIIQKRRNGLYYDVTYFPETPGDYAIQVKNSIELVS